MAHDDPWNEYLDESEESDGPSRAQLEQLEYRLLAGIGTALIVGVMLGAGMAALWPWC